MKTILLATDYSRAATAALEYAATLASFTKAKLVLYNAYHLPIPSAAPPATLPDIDVLIEANKERLENMALEIARRYQIEASAISTTLPFQDGLNEAVKKYGAALVVLGMKTHSLGRKIFGSSTTAVIKHVHYPVLVVPADAEFGDIANILFACDYNSIDIQNRLQLLTELAQTFKSRVHVLHIEKQGKPHTFADSPEAIKIPVMEEILSNIAHCYHISEEADVVKGLKKGIAEHKADLLVMVPRTATHWDSVFSKSKTREMVLETPVPLLVLPNPKGNRLLSEETALESSEPVV